MRKNNPVTKKKRQEPVIVTEKIPVQKTSIKKIRLILALVCCAIAFLFYANTLHHDYTVDDGTVIKNNKITVQGVKAIPTIFKTAYRKGFWDRNESLYRPLSVAMFAIEWELAPDNPHPAHLVNVLLYALTCFFLFYLLCEWIKTKNPLLPFIISILFAGHPIHTEVVANIKSRDEILALLFTLISFLSLAKFLNTRKVLHLFLCGFCFFLALMSKESALTCIAVVPLVLWYFYNDKVLKNHMISMMPFAAGILLYFVLRISVLGSLTNFGGIQAINNSLVNAPDWITQKASAIYILGKYAGLLVLPHPLSFDYSYNQIPNVGMGSAAAIISILIFIGLLVYAISTLKKRNSIGFGILFFFISISLVSNIFFLIESILAERFLYLPSLGFCILLGFLLSKIFKSDFTKQPSSLGNVFTKNTALIFSVLLIFTLYSFKTISRNADWKNNLTLLKKDVQSCPESARIRYAYGSAILIEKALKEKDKSVKDDLLNQAIVQLEKGVSILNSYADAFYHLGIAYKEKGDYPNAIKNFESARRSKEFKDADFYIASGLAYSLGKQYDKGIADFQQALKIDPKNIDAVNNLGVYYDEWGKYDSAIVSLNKALQLDSKQPKSYYNLGNVMAHTGRFNEAIEYYKKTVALKPDDVDALNNIGNSYAAMKDYNNAIVYYKKVIELDPGNSKVLNNIGVTYSILGNMTEADKYIQQSRIAGQR